MNEPFAADRREGDSAAPGRREPWPADVERTLFGP